MGGAGGQAPTGFVRRPAPIRTKPRRVSGGIRLSGPQEAPQGWAGQRWMRVVEEEAPPDHVAQGLEYARSGQTRSIDTKAGHISARVQGRQLEAYKVQIRIPTFTHPQWETVMEHMLAQARYVAKLLAGDLPPSIEDVFIPAGLRLFPTEAQDIAPSCSCGVGQPWCKHVCCVMRLLADRLDAEAFLIFELRGLAQDDLLERARHHRQVAGAGEIGAPIPVYKPHLPGVDDRAIPALDERADSFWQLGGDLEELDIPLDRPEVSYPLLRRLGPSPFESAKFPLFGLMQTCYEVISEAMVAGADAAEVTDEAELDEIEDGSDTDED